MRMAAHLQWVRSELPPALLSSQAWQVRIQLRIWRQLAVKVWREREKEKSDSTSEVKESEIYSMGRMPGVRQLLHLLTQFHLHSSINHPRSSTVARMMLAITRKGEVIAVTQEEMAQPCGYLVVVRNCQGLHLPPLLKLDLHQYGLQRYLVQGANDSKDDPL